MGNGLPPFVLLDGVVLGGAASAGSGVPEPAMLMLVSTGLFGLAGACASLRGPRPSDPHRVRASAKLFAEPGGRA